MYEHWSFFFSLYTGEFYKSAQRRRVYRALAR
jgi:hypothetical protein